MSAAGPMLVVAALVLALGAAVGPLVTGSLPVGRAHVASPWPLPIVRRVAGVPSSWRSRRRSDDDGEVGEVVRLRAAVASGASLLGAFGVLARSDGPWAAAADGVVRRAGAGMSIADALEGWSTGSSGRALVADALAIAGATGASQAAALDAAARTLAERRSLDREVRALASQAVASAVLVVAAPLAFAVLVALADARVRHLYTSTVVGPLCALLGLVLDALGAWWMAVLVRRVR